MSLNRNCIPKTGKTISRTAMNKTCSFRLNEYIQFRFATACNNATMKVCCVLSAKNQKTYTNELTTEKSACLQHFGAHCTVWFAAVAIHWQFSHSLCLIVGLVRRFLNYFSISCLFLIRKQMLAYCHMKST